MGGGQAFAFGRLFSSYFSVSSFSATCGEKRRVVRPMKACLYPVNSRRCLFYCLAFVFTFWEFVGATRMYISIVEALLMLQ